MIEGLWSVEFGANTGYDGAGVVVFESQRVFGGDASYYYVGNYSIDNNLILTAEINVSHYNGPLNNVFGPVKEITIVVAGKTATPSMIIEGSVKGRPDLKIALRLTKRAELP